MGTNDSLIVAEAISSPCTYLVGAAVSGFEPTSLPGAATAVAATFELLLNDLGPSFARLFDPTEAASVLSALDPRTGRLRVPLEVLLGALDGEGGVGADVIVALDESSGAPNVIHHFLGNELMRGRTVVTTNFDEAIERCARGHLDDLRWSGETSAIPPAARLLKVHGTASRRSSLRHTLVTVNRAFPSSVRDAVRSATAGRLCVLGYEGADFDVMELVAPVGERVVWIQRPDAPDPVGVKALSRTRDVVVSRMDLSEVAKLVAGVTARYDGNDIASARSRLAPALTRLSDTARAHALNDLFFQALAADASCVDLDRAFVRFLRTTSNRQLRREAAAARAQNRGTLLGKLKATALHLVMAARERDRSRRWAHFSDAGDVLDGWLVGQGPATRRLTLPIHERAASMNPRRGWFFFRAARSARARGHWDDVAEYLDAAFGQVVDPWEEANCHRLRALANAVNGAAFDSALVRAAELFVFCERTQALADLLRTEATCHLLHGDVSRAERCLVDSIRMHTEYGQRQGARQSRLLLRLLRASPSMARRLAVHV